MTSNAYAKLDLTGKSIIVTGAASGMGAEALKDPALRAKFESAQPNRRLGQTWEIA